MRILENIFQIICEQLLPTSCIACKQFQNAAICRACLNELIDAALHNYLCCTQCGITLRVAEIDKQHCIPCQTTQPFFDATYCLDRYEGLLQHALHELKYQKRIAHSFGLADAWNSIYKEELNNLPANYLLPVPLSLPKLAHRGFNQSWEIVKRIHCRSDVQKSPFILQRHHDYGQQAGSDLRRRQLAVKNQFFIAPKYIEQLQNQTVIVFDDVMTSGATLNEIARILKDNGVSRVINWVLLRATRPI